MHSLVSAKDFHGESTTCRGTQECLQGYARNLPSLKYTHTTTVHCTHDLIFTTAQFSYDLIPTSTSSTIPPPSMYTFESPYSNHVPRQRIASNSVAKMDELPLEAVPCETLVPLDVFLQKHATMVMEPKWVPWLWNWLEKCSLGKVFCRSAPLAVLKIFQLYPMIYSVL